MQATYSHESAVRHQAAALAAQYPKPKKFMNGQIVPGSYVPKAEDFVERARRQLRLADNGRMGKGRGPGPLPLSMETPRRHDELELFKKVKEGGGERPWEGGAQTERGATRRLLKKEDRIAINPYEFSFFGVEDPVIDDEWDDISNGEFPGNVQHNNDDDDDDEDTEDLEPMISDGSDGAFPSPSPNHDS
ncbi:hypothetical protein BDV96DRAFT_568428 [Lophiotrema nucula]|uniref:Uncharacterized protein n=1 Tax=Lophiotrema nucula TaxID=690887 RepID=A0A6A5ZH12_9PLEO|nr:hypothetical protein BDV96DRAFT_568428 [Lophiotrema nucula]